MTLCHSIIPRSHLLAFVLTVTACAGGSGQPDEVPPPAASIGDESPPSEPEATRAPSKGLGSVIVTANVAGRSVAARVKVLDGSSPLEAATGESIALPAGTQRISVAIAEPSALLDMPTQKLSVFVEPGKSTPVEATFRWAKVRLDVLVGGRSQGKVPVKLFRDGELVAELQSGNAPQAISPGKYEADVMLRGRTIHVTGLVFLEGAEQTVPVRAQL